VYFLQNVSIPCIINFNYIKKIGCISTQTSSITENIITWHSTVIIAVSSTGWQYQCILYIKLNVKLINTTLIRYSLIHYTFSIIIIFIYVLFVQISWKQIHQHGQEASNKKIMWLKIKLHIKLSHKNKKF